jgi:hypothetical protein
MGKHLDQENLNSTFCQKKAQEVNHTIITIEEKHDRAWALVVLCLVCNTTFSISVRQYKACPNGCPACKIVENANQADQACELPGISVPVKIDTVKTEQSIESYKILSDGSYNVNWFEQLKTENSYYTFLEECRKKPLAVLMQVFHVHHITPKYHFNENYPLEMAYRDSKPNLIVLSASDHFNPHKIRYAVYGYDQDHGACLLLIGQITLASYQKKLAGAKASKISQKEKGTGIYSEEGGAKKNDTC